MFLKKENDPIHLGLPYILITKSKKKIKKDASRNFTPGT